ncbi:MAG: hypothetical protein K6A32_00130 [Bacteroidales bacterium]|nr:hypothetical protein [Bacteroidales bacterium]
MTKARHTFFYLLAALLMMPLALPAQKSSRSVRMGVLLPLKEKSSRGAKMVEFYQGLLMAVDSMKHLGFSVDVTALHSGVLAADMDSLLATATLGDCDVIFGPLDAPQLPALADYCHLHDIRMVVPFSSVSAQVPSHPLHYLVNAPRHIVQRQATWFAQVLFPKENFVVIKSGEKNDEGGMLVERVRMGMDECGLYVRQISVNASDEAFAEVLAEDRKNVLLLDSPTLPALNALLAKLHQLKKVFPNCQFSLFGYPAWQSYASQVVNDLYEFDTYIYTPFYRDLGNRKVLSVEEQFQQNFDRAVSPSFPRYALFGFDLGFYFLSGLAEYGDDFESNLSAISFDPLQNPLHFQKQGDADGYINDFVQVVHYTTYHVIELLYRNLE